MLHGKHTRMHFTENIGKYLLRIPFSSSMAHPVLKAAFTLSGIRKNARPTSVSYTCKINTSKFHLRRDFERLSGRYFQIINNTGETLLSGQCTSWKRGSIGSWNSFLIIGILQLFRGRGKKSYDLFISSSFWTVPSTNFSRGVFWSEILWLFYLKELKGCTKCCRFSDFFAVILLSFCLFVRQGIHSNHTLAASLL